MSLLPANATDFERALEGVITDLLTGLPIPIRALRLVDECPAEQLPYLAWERAVPEWDAAWEIDLKRAVVRAAFGLHAGKGTVSADRRILDGAGAIYTYVEGAGSNHHTVAVKVHNAGTLRVTLASLRAAIDAVRRASVHYTFTHEIGFSGPLLLAGGFAASAFAPRFEGGL